MRKSGLVLALLVIAQGCSQPPSTRPPMPRPGASAPKMNLDEIGKSAFGTLYRSSRKQGDTAEYVFAAPEDKGPPQIYRRSVILASTAIPTTFRNEPGVQNIRFTTVDPKRADRRLAVFSIDREQGKKVGGHGSFDALLGIVKVEYADPEYRAAAGVSNK